MICTLHKDHPENTEMPPAMLLEHFLNCIDRQRQEELLAELRTQAQAGSRCWMADHDGVIRSQATYTAKLLTGIREVIADGEHGHHVGLLTAKLKDLVS